MIGVVRDMVTMKVKRVLKKLLGMIITVFFVLIFNYVLFRLLPGSFLTNLGRTSHVSAAQMEMLQQYYGMDGTALEQFFGYLKNLMKLDLGISYAYRKPVWDVIKVRIWPTVLVLGVSEIFSIIIGMTSGVLAAWKRGKPLDTGLLSGSLFFYAMPTFWMAMMLILLFSSTLGWLPPGNMVTTGKIFVSELAKVKDVVRHMILPVICMSIGFAGSYCITMRSTMMDVLSEDYITTARAKGFSESYVLRKHALPNAMLPMTTLVCMNLGFIIAGAVQLETMFNWPGIGSLMYSAISDRDYTLLQGLFLLTTVSIIVANALADILYGLIDPRIKS